MDVEFTVPWTEDLVMAAQRHIVKDLSRRYRPWFLIAALTLGAVAIAGYVHQNPVVGFLWLVLAACMVSISLLGPGMLVGRLKQNVQAHFRKFGSYDVVFRIDDDGISTKTPTAHSRMTWDKFETLWCLPDIWILYVTKRSFDILPADKVAGEVGDFIVEKVRANGGEVK